MQPASWWCNQFGGVAAPIQVNKREPLRLLFTFSVFFFFFF
jgi:hypothetical protein